MNRQYLSHSNLVQLKSREETWVEGIQVQGISTQGEVGMQPREVLSEVKGTLERFCFYTFLCTSKVSLKEKAKL